MSDKWNKLSIYDVDFSLTDDEGEEHHFTFKPLPWAYYPKAFGIFSKLEESGLFKGQEDMGDKEVVSHLLNSLNEELIKELGEIEKIAVKNSYPEKDDEIIEAFVMGNLFHLIMPMSQLISRQSKNTRKVQQVMGNEPSK